MWIGLKFSFDQNIRNPYSNFIKHHTPPHWLKLGLAITQKQPISKNNESYNNCYNLILFSDEVIWQIVLKLPSKTPPWISFLAVSWTSPLRAIHHDSQSSFHHTERNWWLGPGHSSLGFLIIRFHLWLQAAVINLRIIGLDR